MRPSYNDDDKMFCDNSGWKIGSSEQLTIEDREGNQTIINLDGFEDLKQWNVEFLSNRSNSNYDWHSWKKHGFDLATQVAKVLPENVALFYLYDNEQVVERYNDLYKLYLCHDGEPIRIK